MLYMASSLIYQMLLPDFDTLLFIYNVYIPSQENENASIAASLVKNLQCRKTSKSFGLCAEMKFKESRKWLQWQSVTLILQMVPHLKQNMYQSLQSHQVSSVS